MPRVLGGLLSGVTLASLLAGCGGDGDGAANGGGAADGRTGAPADSIVAVGPPAQPGATSTNGPAAPRSGPPVVLFLGTSLTAGLGIEPSQAWPERVGELAAAAGTPIRVVNAGLSGETSAGALRRADWVLGRTPADVIVIETGANDGLRAFEVATIRANIDSLVAKARATQPHARVVLVQMEAPPNLGEQYAQDFHAIYPAVAKQYGIPLVPFLLEGVAGKPELNQADGIHPTPAGARIAAGTVWRVLGPVVASLPPR
jgi:acyl-CoA thioesterase-1